MSAIQPEVTYAIVVASRSKASETEFSPQCALIAIPLYQIPMAVIGGGGESQQPRDSVSAVTTEKQTTVPKSNVDKGMPARKERKNQH